MEALLRFKSAASPLVVDPKIPHLDCYAGATLVTPNHHEAEAATHRRIRTDEDARAAAREFRERARCEAALVTRGEQGMWLSSADAEGGIPAVAREVSDVTGAGDTVVATRRPRAGGRRDARRSRDAGQSRRRRRGREVRTGDGHGGRADHASN